MRSAPLLVAAAAFLLASCLDAEPTTTPDLRPSFHGKDEPEKCDLEGAECVFDLEDLSAYAHTPNMALAGFSPRFVPAGTFNFNTDLAFWGTTAYQGTYRGFRIIDISDPANPLHIFEVDDCMPGSGGGQQGDVVAWGNLLVRSWNPNAPSGATCRGTTVPQGWKGLHVFDVSNPMNPVVVAAVQTPCGSHTATAVPDPANHRLLIYNSPSSSSAACLGIDIIEIPLGDPAASSYLGLVSSGGGINALSVFDGVAEGSYVAAPAAFGPQTTVAGMLSLADPADGCEPLVGFEAGHIAVIDRGGGCLFAHKVRNAQDAGAVGVVVVNNVSGGTITMVTDDPAGIEIPAAMISLHNGNLIKPTLPVEGELQLFGTGASPARPCHDTAVILGAAKLAACAGGNGFAVWSLDPRDGGSLTSPVFLYGRSIPGVTIGHSASFTWDGEVLVFGHEAGGGSQARCQATSEIVDRSIFFFRARTGTPLGSFVLPRPQTAQENCSWHNFNVVPTPGRSRYVLVAGNYQSGISVVDFSNPANAHEIAYADPVPLADPNNPTAMILAGDWSAYWYNGHIYESDIRRGLLVWRLDHPSVNGSRVLPHLNPQTQDVTFNAAPRPPGHDR